MPGWLASLLAFLIDKLTGRQRALGQAEGAAAEQARQRAVTDNLQAHYDEIAAAPLAPDAAFDRLRARAAPAPSNDNGGGGGVPP